jgi:endonuclease III
MPLRKTRLQHILDRLEKFHGKPRPPWPTDPCELVIHRNAGYPQSDANCAKGFEALRAEVGITPKKILAAPMRKLAHALRAGGIVPELRARRLKEIAARVEDEFAGDLNAVLKRPAAEARRVFTKFPTVGLPTADKILLYTKSAPIAAIPSNCVHVPLRLGFGHATKNYAADYRAAQEALEAVLPEDCDALLRAYLLLKQHGQEICKSARPRCEECPITDQCAYFHATRTA